MERNFILGAIIVIVVAAGAATGLHRRDANELSTSAVGPTTERTKSPLVPRATPKTDRIDWQPSSPVEDHRDGALIAHVEHKYRYLLADVESARIEELKRRLLEREDEVNIAHRASTDERVGELLAPRELEYYQALKDSDTEQHHVSEYAGGIGNVAALDERQERELLDAKLRHKQRYATALRDLGLDRDVLSSAERAYAHAHVAEALKGYFNDFLIDVSPTLTPEQYALLRNYETTEFQRELERVQQQIDTK